MEKMGTELAFYGKAREFRYMREIGPFSKEQRKKAGWPGMKTAGLGYVELPLTARSVGSVVQTASALLLLRGNDLSLRLTFPGKAAPRCHTLGLSLPLV